MSVDTKKSEWVSRSEALRILECSRTLFLRLIDEGAIRCRDMGHKRYWREDVERLSAPPNNKPAA